MRLRWAEKCRARLRFDPVAVPSLASQGFDPTNGNSRAGLRSLYGLEERSYRPAMPAVRNRPTHRATVFGQMPEATAAASGIFPSSSTRRTSRLVYAASIVHSCERLFCTPRSNRFVGKHQHLQSGPSDQQPICSSHRDVIYQQSALSAPTSDADTFQRHSSLWGRTDEQMACAEPIS